MDQQSETVLAKQAMTKAEEAADTAYKAAPLAVVTAVPDQLGVATTFGVPGSAVAGAFTGTAFIMASQSAPLNATLEDGTRVGQRVTVSQKQGAANAVTLLDAERHTT